MTSAEAMEEYLRLAYEDGNPKMIQLALAAIARAQNMTALAKKTGISRVGLYKALDTNNSPEHATIQNLVNALGIKLQPVMVKAAA